MSAGSESLLPLNALDETCEQVLHLPCTLLEPSIVSAAEGLCRHKVTELHLNLCFRNEEEDLGFLHMFHEMSSLR
jgi:hypothetical protein